MISRRWKYIKLILGVTAISFSPLAVKVVSFAPSVSAFYRSFYAAFFFLLFALAQSIFRNKRALPDISGRKHLGWFVPSAGAGIFLGIDLIIWHKTIIYLGAGPATFLGNSQILFVTIFAAIVFKEHIPFVFYPILATVMTGLYLLMPVTAGGVSKPAGYIMGLVVGATYAGMLICLRYAKNISKEKYPELFSLGTTFLVSSVIIFFSSQVLEHTTIASWGTRNHLLIAATALFCQTFGWYMINSSITKIPAHEGSLLLMLQPLLATIWGCILFFEPLRALQITGIILALSGIIWYQLTKKEDSIPKQTEEEEIL